MAVSVGVFRLNLGGERMSSHNWGAKYRYICSRNLILFLFCIGFAVSAGAQVSGGSFTGRVTDPSGAVVPNAKVVVQNTATGVATTIATNSAGVYSAPALNPGTYEITVAAPGFVTSVRAGLTLTVGAQESINFALQVGSVQKTVTVTGAAPMIQTTNSTISAVVNEASVQQLPLNGRSWTDLAALQPGVDTILTQPSFNTGSDRGNRGYGGEVTISGTRPQMNNYLLDGISLNDYANGAPGSVTGSSLGVDAIREFSVLTTNYSAQYGKTAGGVVNAVTRSGTNRFHGAAYEFIRNDKLDAANYFESGHRSPFKRNQFGGDIGGPIVKNKTFFFGDYEGIRQAQGTATVDNVLSNNARVGNMATTGSSPLIVPVSAFTQRFLALIPTSNDPSCPAADPSVPSTTDVCTFRFSPQQILREDFFTTRIDQTFSGKDSLYGTFVYDRAPFTAPDGYNNVLIENFTDRQYVAAQETHVFSPTFINAIRFGFGHESVNDSTPLSALNPAAADPTLGTFPGENASQLTVSGLTPMGGGLGGNAHYFYRWSDYQFYDDANSLRGTHNIKFGVNFERDLLNWTTITDPSGVWGFGSVSAFVQGHASKFQGGVPGFLTPRNLRQNIFGLYFEDDWQAKPSLTLNLGMRYEMTTVPNEANGKFINLYNIGDEYPVCGTYIPGTTPGSCNTVGPLWASNPTLYNFEPRFGFAWSPKGNGKLAIRGGVGMFDVLPLTYQFTLMEGQAAPFFHYTVLSSGIDFATNTIPPISQLPNSSLRSTYMQSHPGRSYIYQYNLNIQYQIVPSMAVMVAYVGSNGFHMPYRADDVSGIVPTATNAGPGNVGYIFPQVDALGNIWDPTNGCTQLDPNGSDPSVCAAPLKTNNYYGSVHGMIYEGRANYNALEVGLTKRMSHGLQFQGSFTWGRSIDTNSATVAGDQFQNSISSLPWWNMRLSRAVSDFNIKRNFVLSALYNVPGPKSGFAAARWVADGWQLGGILTLQDGLPFTMTWGTGSDPANTLSGDDYAYPSILTGAPGCGGSLVTGNPYNFLKANCFSVPVAPNQAYWNANCDPAPPSLGDTIANNTSYLPALACFNLMGNATRNHFLGKGITNLDFSVYKNNYIKRISENFNIQFRAEFFNILNHADFGVPSVYDGNSDIFDGTGASLAPVALVRTTVPQREVQFALKVMF